MKRAIILFGSTSDSNVYEPLQRCLEELGMTVTTRALSAHRQPQELGEFLATEVYDVVLAGAGLAAHLPGVCASKTLKPVIGIPVSGAFSGFDAYLAIVQMPAGVPVLCSPVDDNVAAPLFLQHLLKLGDLAKSKIHLVAPESQRELPYVAKALQAAKTILADANVSFSISEVSLDDSINIVLSFLNEKIEQAIWQSSAAIVVPMIAPEELQNPENALSLFKRGQEGGLLVGTNNMRNAVLMTLRLQNANGQFDALLNRYKKGV